MRNIVTLNMGDDIAKSIALRQNEVYQNQLADFLISGKPADEIISLFDMYGYTKGQGITRGIGEGVDYLTEDEDENVSYQEERIKREIDDELEDALNSQSSVAPQVNVPVFDIPEMTSTERMSPSILPNEKDREIAVRDVSQGIGSLV